MSLTGFRRRNIQNRIYNLNRILRTVRVVLEVDDFLEEIRRIECTRAYWVHPVNKNRPLQGDGLQLYQELRVLDDSEFFNYTRMSIDEFDHLLNLIFPTINKIKTRPDVIPAHARLFLVLR